MRALLPLIAILSALSLSGCGSKGDVNYTCNCDAVLPNPDTGDEHLTVILAYCGADDSEGDGVSLAQAYGTNECFKKTPGATECGCFCSSLETACSTPSKP